MSKVIKKMQLDSLRKTFADVRDLVVLSVSGLTSQGEHTFRNTLRKKGVRIQVVKNSLTRLVFDELKFQVDKDSPYWQKNTMLAWGAGSIKELSQGIEAELKNPKTAALYKDKVKIKGAIAEGAALPFEQAIKMPTRLELIGQIIGSLLAPASAIAGCLTASVSQVASQIKQIAEKKEDEAAPPPVNV